MLCLSNQYVPAPIRNSCYSLVHSVLLSCIQASVRFCKVFLCAVTLDDSSGKCLLHRHVTFSSFLRLGTCLAFTALLSCSQRFSLRLQLWSNLLYLLPQTFSPFVHWAVPVQLKWLTSYTGRSLHYHCVLLLSTSVLFFFFLFDLSWDYLASSLVCWWNAIA